MPTVRHSMVFSLFLILAAKVQNISEFSDS